MKIMHMRRYRNGGCFNIFFLCYVFKKHVEIVFIESIKSQSLLKKKKVCKSLTRNRQQILTQEAPVKHTEIIKKQQKQWECE